MRVKYSTRSPYNPLSTRPTSRFAVHPAAFSGLATGFHDTARYNLSSPTCLDPGCHPFDLCLACPRPTHKDHLDSKSLRREPTVPRISPPLAKPAKRGE